MNNPALPTTYYLPLMFKDNRYIIKYMIKLISHNALLQTNSISIRYGGYGFKPSICNNCF